MKINFDQQFKVLSGETMKDDQNQPLTLKWACIFALLSDYPKEEIEGNEKLARYKLACRIDRGGDVELSTDDISKIKKLTGKALTPLVVGQAHLMLERKRLDESGNEVGIE